MNKELQLISSFRKQFLYYKSLGDKTFNQIDDQGLFHFVNEENNSIAIIVNHMAGNMLSRWTDFLNSDGEKEWRQRDQEFENVLTDRSKMLEKWEEGWACLFAAIDSISEENIDQLVYIRNQGHTIPEALLRQLAHYAYHVGQIVYLGKILKNKDWESLSIPKGNSAKYNEEKFSKDKHKAHFTDEYIDPETPKKE